MGEKWESMFKLGPDQIIFCQVYFNSLSDPKIGLNQLVYDVPGLLSTLISIYFFPAEGNCPGGQPLNKDGECPDFACSGPLSCSNRGYCNSDQTACICNDGFARVDCSFDLTGKYTVNCFCPKTKDDFLLSILSNN